MAKRKQRTKEELRRALDHLYYEYGMFCSLTGLLASGTLGPGILHNATLESFTLHARIVLDFLYAKEKVLRNEENDDVIAEDYVSIEVWRNTRSSKTSLLEGVHKRVGKEVAHLTYARQDVTPETKPWRFVEIAKDVDVVLKKFIEVVPQEWLGESWVLFKTQRSYNRDPSATPLEASDTGVTNPHSSFRIEERPTDEGPA